MSGNLYKMREIVFYFIENELTFYDLFTEYLECIGRNVSIGVAWLSPKKHFSLVYNKDGKILSRNGFKNIPVGKNSFGKYLKEVAEEIGLSPKITLKMLRDTILSTWSHTTHSNEMG